MRGNEGFGDSWPDASWVINIERTSINGCRIGEAVKVIIYTISLLQRIRLSRESICRYVIRWEPIEVWLDALILSAANSNCDTWFVKFVCCSINKIACHNRLLISSE